MNWKRFGRLSFPPPAPDDPAGGGGGGGGDGGGSPGGADPNAWKTSLAGENSDHAKLLEGFKDPSALFERLSSTTTDAADWKKLLAGDNADDQKLLERFTDGRMFLKSYRDTQTAFHDGGRVKVPGAEASDEERAAFAKAIGVPEKMDGYEITAKPAEGLELGEGDKAAVDTITKRLHDALAQGASPTELMNLSRQIYYDMAADAAVQGETRAADAAAEGEAENRKLWGSQYEDNINLAATGMREYFPGTQEEFEKFAGLKLETGHALFDHPVVQQMFAQIAKDRGEDPVFNALRRETQGGFNIEGRIKEIQKKRLGTTAERAEYAKLAAPGGELDKLIEARDKHKGGGETQAA
jgi:hypothetical protein